MDELVHAMIAAVIVREGEYSDHPADRGGATRWGITEAVARAAGYRGAMHTLPRTVAAEIYRRRYWAAPAFDRIAERDPTLAAELFDTGVNMGPAAAVRFLQRGLNALNRAGLDVDGVAGAATRAALDAYRARRSGNEGAAVLLWAVRALRTNRYVEIVEQDAAQHAFGYGWVARQVREAGA